MNIDRIYHPHTVWEEVGYNMWGSVDNRALYLDMAIKLLEMPICTVNG